MARTGKNERRATAREFGAYMDSMELRSVEGAQLIASALYCKLNTVMSFYSRGILRTELELLKLKIRGRGKHARIATDLFPPKK